MVIRAYNMQLIMVNSSTLLLIIPPFATIFLLFYLFFYLRYDCIILFRISFKPKIIHEWLTTEASKRRMCLISNCLIRITLWVLGLSRNLFHIMKDITTIVGITHRGKGCECRVFERLLLFLLSWPPVRGVCPNHEVVMFQPWTVNPP